MELRGLVLKRYQEETFKYIASNKVSAVFESVGFGKTPIVIKEIANHKSTIVFVEANNIKQFEGELLKFLVIDKSSVFSMKENTSRKKRISFYKEFDSAPDGKILIINYEKIRVDFDFIRSITYDMIVFDESQILSNINKTSDLAYFLAIKADKVVSMTATPFSRVPSQLYNHFKNIGNPIAMDYYEFLDNFAVFDIIRINKYIPHLKRYNLIKIRKEVGFKNKSELKALVRHKWIKHDMEKLAKRYPDEFVEKIKNYYIRYAELTPDQKQKIATMKTDLVGGSAFDFYYGEIRILNFPEYNKEEFESVAVNRHLDKYAKNSPKIKILHEIIASIPPEDKIVIYTHFVHFSEILARALGCQHSFVNGTLKQSIIDKRRERFNEDPTEKFLVMTDVGMRGWNLPVSHNLILFDSPPVPDDIVQITGRIDRFTQLSYFLNYFFILTNSSVEENLIEKVIERSKDQIDVLGAKIDFLSPLEDYYSTKK